MPFFDDDGNEINPDFYPKPGLCLICKKLKNPYEQITCTLNRVDQRYEKEFECGAFEKNENE